MRTETRNPETRNSKLFISELNYALHDAPGAMIVARQVEHDPIAWFQRIYNSLKVGERCNRSAIDARNDFTDFDIQGPHVSRKSIRIHFFDVESFHAGQPLVGN